MSVPAGFIQTQLARIVRIEPRETATVFAAFLLYFFVLGSYFAVRPVRETVGTLLGSAIVADLWLYTAVFSIAIVPIYGWLVANVRRSVLLPCIYGFAAVVLGVAGLSFDADRVNPATGSFFYVSISVLSFLLVSVFFSFLLEIFSREQSKRLFGFIAAGGTLGALIGPLTTRFAAGFLGNEGILFLGAAGFVGAIVCQVVLIGLWRSGPAPAAATEVSPSTPVEDRGLGGNPFAGITLVLKSPYLIGIALFVVLLSYATTTLYFEQLRIVEATFADVARRTEVFASIDFVVQSLTILTQIFFTGRIAMKLGVRWLLTIIPLVMIVGFLLLATFNVFAALVIVFVLRRSGEYALIRPGREMLFSGLDTETKYKAKNFIDVPVYRAADYVGAQAKTAIDAVTASPTVSLIVGAVMAGVWAVLGWVLGRRQDSGRL